MLDLLRQELIVLAQKLQPYNIKLIIGGGYGLLLRTEFLSKNDSPTLFNNIPIARSTNDLDIFLSTEIVTSLEKMKIIRNTLNHLGYEPKPGAEFYQFAREVDIQGQSRFLKLDFLCPTITDQKQDLVEQDQRRVRPKSAKKLKKEHKLHARNTKEAISLEDYLQLIYINDQTYVYIPHPFTYLILKLFAIKDHLDQPETKGKSQHHAFDLYRTVAMLTEIEDHETTLLARKYPDITQQANSIVKNLFNGIDSLGSLALRRYFIENQMIITNQTLIAFLNYLHDLF
jgi:hypothetical protein